MVEYVETVRNRTIGNFVGRAVGGNALAFETDLTMTKDSYRTKPELAP